MPILHAASPVEIEAKAEGLALPGAARRAALSLFHDLTSREELIALGLPVVRDGRQGGAAWPVHCLLFGTAAELQPVLDALRARPDTGELPGDRALQGGAPRVLFLVGSQDGFSGVLLACDAQARLEEVLRGIEADSAPAA